MKTSCTSVALLIASALLCQAASATEHRPERTEFELGLIGRKWIQTIADYGQSPVARECNYTGGQLLQQNQKLALDYFTCTDGRTLSLITQKLPPAHGMVSAPTLVLDAFLFPELKEGESLVSPGECSLNGDISTDFTALVRFGEHEFVDWQTGVLAAWIPNVRTKQYEPLSTRHIVCGVETDP